MRRDYAEAMGWLRKSAEQGYAESQWLLGLGYAVGRGVPQDLISALMWFNLAAADGFADAAKIRDDIAKLMTPGQIAEAEKLAREWKPKSQ